MPRTTLVDRMMNELTIYGGLVMRRCDVLRLAKEHLGEHAKEPFGAQYFAFHPPALEDQTLEPWPLEEARKIMSR